MTKKTNSIEPIARKHLNDLGYSQFQLVCTEKQTPHGLEAMINNDTYKIDIFYAPDWREQYDGIRRLHLARKQTQSPGKFNKLVSRLSRKNKISSGITPEELKKIENAYGNSSDVLQSVTYHEHGHWSVCPFDLEHLETILDSVSRGLRDSGLDENIVKQRTWGKANEFEDIVVNCALALDYPSTVKGRGLKYLREAFVPNEKKPCLPASYSVFADVQMRLINPAADFAEDYCKEYKKEVKPIVDKILMAFGKKHQLGPAAVSNALTEKEKAEFIENLKNPENWGELAYEYTKLTAHLEPQTMESLTPFFSKLKEDPDFRGQLIQIALQKGHEPGLYNDSFEVFQQEHKRAGARIRHDIFSSEGDNALQYALPYAFLSAKKTDNPFKANFGKTRTAVGGGLQFKKKDHPLVLPPSCRTANGSLADLLLVCDNSGSMAGRKYKLLVSTAYAIFQGIKEENKAHLLKYGLLQFSDSRCQSWTGWHNTTEPLEKSFYNTMASNRFGRETILPVNLLKSADKEDCALIGISDGHIHNSSEAINALLEHNGPLIWFQVGGETDVYNAIKRHASQNKDKIVIAHLVNNITELPQSLLCATHSLYKRGDE